MKIVSIYSGPLLAGILLAMLGGLNVADGINSAEDYISILGLLWALFLLYNSIQVRYEA